MNRIRLSIIMVFVRLRTMIMVVIFRIMIMMKDIRIRVISNNDPIGGDDDEAGENEMDEFVGTLENDLTKLKFLKDLSKKVLEK